MLSTWARMVRVGGGTPAMRASSAAAASSTPCASGVTTGTPKAVNACPAAKRSQLVRATKRRVIRAPGPGWTRCDRGISSAHAQSTRPRVYYGSPAAPHVRKPPLGSHLAADVLAFAAEDGQPVLFGCPGDACRLVMKLHGAPALRRTIGWCAMLEQTMKEERAARLERHCHCAICLDLPCTCVALGRCMRSA